MAVEIFGVDKNSLAERAGIKPHDKLISINGHDITDILDFRFYETNTHLRWYTKRRKVSGAKRNS